MILWEFCVELIKRDLPRDIEKNLLRINEIHAQWENTKIVLDDACVPKDEKQINGTPVCCRASGVLMTGEREERIRDCLKEYLAFISDCEGWEICDLKEIPLSDFFRKRSHFERKIDHITKRLGLGGIEILKKMRLMRKQDVYEDKANGITIGLPQCDLEPEQDYPLTRVMQAEMDRYLHEDPDNRSPRIYVGSQCGKDEVMGGIAMMLSLRNRLKTAETQNYLVARLHYQEGEKGKKQRTIQEKILKGTFPIIKGGSIIFTMRLDDVGIDPEMLKTWLPIVEKSDSPLILVLENRDTAEPEKTILPKLCKIVKKYSSRKMVNLSG